MAEIGRKFRLAQVSLAGEHGAESGGMFGKAQVFPATGLFVWLVTEHVVESGDMFGRAGLASGGQFGLDVFASRN